MKKKLAYAILLLLTLSFLSYCYLHHTQPSGQSAGQSPPPANVIEPSATAPPDLSLHAAGACLMDASSGRILYGKKENEQLPMASTTKIMTCLLALECGNPSDAVSFSEKATRMPKVHLGAPKGTEFTLGSLLYSLMLESHNDTAVAIAEHIGGSVEGFAAMMNAKARELGMNLTHFVTPNGLDADGHKSTPSDMCRLAAYACQNETFLQIISTPSKQIKSVNGKLTYSLTNRDAFLTLYRGSIGIKTGFTGKAGYCFVGAAKRDGRTFTSCVLASGWPPDKSWKWADTKALMDFGFTYYSYRQIPAADFSSRPVPVENGKKHSVKIRQPDMPLLLASPFERAELSYDFPSRLNAPVQPDIPVGSVTISINGQTVHTASLYPDCSVPQNGFYEIFMECLEHFCNFY